jgi:hypothetical protein
MMTHGSSRLSNVLEILRKLLDKRTTVLHVVVAVVPVEIVMFLRHSCDKARSFV